MTLRPVERRDLPLLRAARQGPDADPWGFFGYAAAESLEKAFEANGLLSADKGTLAVVRGKDLLGRTSWVSVEHGPTAACRALNVGITLFPDARGKGAGPQALQALTTYLFATTTVERLEAGTDVGNIPAQRGLEKCGFVREGVMRHAQFRDGRYRDIALYSRLRGD